MSNRQTIRLITILAAICGFIFIAQTAASAQTDFDDSIDFIDICFSKFVAEGHVGSASCGGSNYADLVSESDVTYCFKVANTTEFVLKNLRIEDKHFVSEGDTGVLKPGEVFEVFIQSQADVFSSRSMALLHASVFDDSGEVKLTDYSVAAWAEIKVEPKMDLIEKQIPEPELLKVNEVKEIPATTLALKVEVVEEPVAVEVVSSPAKAELAFTGPLEIAIVFLVGLSLVFVGYVLIRNNRNARFIPQTVRVYDHKAAKRGQQ